MGKKFMQFLTYAMLRNNEKKNFCDKCSCRETVRIEMDNTFFTYDKRRTKKNWTQTQNAEFVFSTIPEPNALLIFPVNFSHFRFWAAACVRFIDCVQSIRFMKWTTANKKFVLKCHIEGQSSHTLPHVQITTDRTMRSSSGKQKESKKKSCYTTSERNRKKCS